MKGIKLKQSFVLEKSVDYLSILHELRKESDKAHITPAKLDEIDSFIHKCIELAEYYDYLNSNLNLDLRVFKNFSDKNILKELLNRAHSEGDIFLYADSNVFQKGDPTEIRITIFRKLLERLALKFLDLPKISKVLMSKDHQEYLRSRIELSILKDYKSLSLTEIPPYRIWDKKNKKMIYFKPISIDPEIEKLEGVISGYHEKSKPISNEYWKFLNNFYQTWWIEYKNIINREYKEIDSHFLYYEGVNIKATLSKTFMKLPKNFSQSDLTLCVGKERTERGTCDIDLDCKIYPILFLDEYFNDIDDVTGDLAFDLNTYKNDLSKIIKSSIEIDIKEELLNLFKLHLDDVIFKIFSNKMLSLMGIHVKETKEEVGIQYNISCQEKTYKIVRFNKKGKTNVKNIEKQRQKGKEIIILSSTIIPRTIKKKYEKDMEIHLKDINDLLDILSTERINHSEIIDGVIYSFLKDKLKNQKINMRLYSAQKLLHRLKNCPKGLKGWRTFEDICIDIIDFVFRESFRDFRMKIQSRNYNNLDIRDAIVQNTGEKEFWKDLRSDYNAKNVVFEFKNLSKKLGKDELIQISNYLKKDSLGRVGIVFSREGLSKMSGIKEQRELLILDTKLILVLNENDLMDLVDKKLLNEETEQILESLKFELETSI